MGSILYAAAPRWRAWIGLAALAVVLGACNGGKSQPTQQALEFGLDARVSNTTCVAFNRPPMGAGTVELTQVFTKVAFESPIAMAQIPGDDTRWYVAERAGRIRLLPARDDATASDLQTVIDISDRVSTRGEGGLLGFALHPQFALNGQMFLSYTAPGAPLESRLSRFGTTDNGQAALPDEDLLLSFQQPFDNHNGGHLLFGPDGYLYIAFGDGGSQDDPDNRSQNRNVLLGKMLRLDVDRADVAQGRTYSIPADNPWANGGALPEIYALGFRNPWRFSFDRDGQLWVGDVGGARWEEIDLVTKGGNYGWRIREGMHPHLDGGTAVNLIDPIFEYAHDVGQSITGGYVYRGHALANLVGAYVYADFQSGNIWALRRNAATGAYDNELLLASGQLIVSFAEGNDGELYILNILGPIYRLAPSAMAPNSNTLPATLDATGCFKKGEPSASLIPYSVQSSLYADDATKRRWLSLPDGSQIHVESDGRLTFPLGTVLFKEFARAGVRLETRLMVRHADGDWAGYTYAWTADGSQANLLATVDERNMGEFTWKFPSRSQCLQCHTQTTQRILGFSLPQLDGEMLYPTTDRLASQRKTLEHIGVFDATLPASKTPLVDPFKSGANVESQARAYLHANCAGCHRPQGTGRGPANFMYDVSLADMHICNAEPQNGSLQIDGAKLLAPGEPSRSLIVQRMRRRDTNGMPPVGTSQVDDAGVALIEAWIQALPACP